MPKPRLWEAVVSVEVTIVVVAGDEELAKAEAREAVYDVLDEAKYSEDCDTRLARELSKDDGLPERWNADCMPYGSEFNRTIADYREAAAAYVRTDDEPIPDCPGQTMFFPDSTPEKA